MRASTLRAVRFLRTWLSGSSEVDIRDVEIPSTEPEAGQTADRDGHEANREASGADENSRGRAGGASTGSGGRSPSYPATYPATVFRPPGSARSGARRGWVVLHGVTRPGRRHRQLVRFCTALASAGNVAVVPEIREWAELRLAPERTVPAVRASLGWLRASTEGAVGLVGFSFGAPQALRAAAHPALQTRIGGVAGFGGYFDIHRAVRFQLTGLHEWQGREERLDPDPYARWIMAANHLTDIPEHADAEDVARALRRLAIIAGDERIPADAPEMDGHRRSLRTGVDPSRQPLFDLLALGPGSGGGEDSGREPSDRRLARLEALADALSDAALRTEPLLDVRPHLSGVQCPVELVHGRFDRLIPYTESRRLAAAFPPEARVRLTVTELFSHTEGRSLGAGLRAAREGWRFFAALRRVLGLV